MAWARGPAFAGAPRDFPANLAFGVEPSGALALPLAVLGGVLVVALLLRERRGVLSPVAARPRRFARPPRARRARDGRARSPGANGRRLPAVRRAPSRRPRRRPSRSPPGRSLSAFLARALPDVGGPLARRDCSRGSSSAPARAGKTIAAAGYWGPELDYRLARLGASGSRRPLSVGRRGAPRLVPRGGDSRRDARARSRVSSLAAVSPDRLRPAARLARVGGARLAPRTRRDDSSQARSSTWSRRSPSRRVNPDPGRVPESGPASRGSP